MGRPPKLTPAQQAEARRRRAQGATLAELAQQLRRGQEHDFEADGMRGSLYVGRHRVAQRSSPAWLNTPLKLSKLTHFVR